jgi:hypothetical protein
MQLNFCSRFAWLWAAASLLSAHATTVVPPTFEQLADSADLVFIGKAVASRGKWEAVGANRVISTTVDFEAEEVLKGNADKNISLRFLGGTVDDVRMEVVGVPRFKAGDRVVLFVRRNGQQFCPIVGVFHGKFGVRKEEATGRDIVLKHDGKPLRHVTEIGMGDDASLAPPGRAKAVIPDDAPPLSLSSFKTKVRDHLKGRATQ